MRSLGELKRWSARPRAAAAGVVALVALAAALPTAAQAVPASKVFLNGRPHPVYFNDGDSFRVLAGPLEGTKARLAGYNTLESYGAVHQWGGWSRHELYRNAKLGTLNARRGVWRCTSDMKRDGYGRILWWCPDLAEDQIRKGFAHAMTVTKAPASERLLRAQREAQRARRGMWAHGVPRYIVTSTHSNDEGYSGKTYNRLVSADDGHSEKWLHNDVYKECQLVCHRERTFTAAGMAAGLARLRGDAASAGLVQRYSDAQLRQIVRRRDRKEDAAGLLLDPSQQGPLLGAIDALLAAQAFGPVSDQPDSCMVYAPFRRRYGPRSAGCLH
jgi:endonuclease YncB( thermonuclease family)